MSRRVTSPGSRAQCAGVDLVGACQHLLGSLRARGDAMDLNANAPTVQRALGLALMRQALEYLSTIGEDEASSHLSCAIDALLRPKNRPEKSPVT